MSISTFGTAYLELFFNKAVEEVFHKVNKNKFSYLFIFKFQNLLIYLKFFYLFIFKFKNLFI